tara:strand:- start:567 stop:1145 length:579 start_codon:yes stop_codon:yes gene_type:complete
MDPFEVYKLYNALKLHFESDYDAVKYNFKSNVTPNSFFKRRDKYFFAKLGKNQKDILNFLVFNFIEDIKYIGDMMDSDGEQNYRKHKRVHESLSREFQKDINNIETDFDNLLVVNTINTPPLIVQKWMEEEVSLETVVILDSLTGFIKKEGNKISETILWPDVSRKITKYGPFVNFDKNKFINLLKERFTLP